MYRTEIDWMLHKAHHEELLQIAAKERLAKEARRSKSNHQILDFIFIHGLVGFFIGRSSSLLPIREPRGATYLPNTARKVRKPHPSLKVE